MPLRDSSENAITRSLSNANVEITQAYSAAFPESDEAVIVLHTANDVRAIDVLQKM